jgi:hypothetical protein
MRLTAPTSTISSAVLEGRRRNLSRPQSASAHAPKSAIIGPRDQGTATEKTSDD